MAENKSFFEVLVDFSFTQCITARYAKLIYGLHLLVGLIVAIAFVVSGFQQSPSQGLLVLLLAVIGFFFWSLYVRMAIELLLAVFRTADNIARVSGPRES